VTNGPVDRILWQRLDKPGLEWCEISRSPDRTQVAGVALVAHAGVPYRIEYAIVDVDLGFSPMTNSLPIWRLGLAPGETRAIRAAWVRFPEFTVEVLRQTYERADQFTYLYRSDGFEASLSIDNEGIVEEYGSYWRVVARQRLDATKP